MSSGEPFRRSPHQQVQTFCAFQAEGPIPSSEYYALEVANAAIGESMGSRLFQELRERRGLCYSVFSAPSLMEDASLFGIYATASKETAAPLVDALAEELVRIARTGMEEGEIADAKAHIRGSMKIAAADAEYRMRRLARQALYGAPNVSTAEADAGVAKVDAAAANEAMRRFFVHAPAFFGVGSRAAERSFTRSALRALDRMTALGMKVVD
jgi:predicted Zn-dependent peptidase